MLLKAVGERRVVLIIPRKARKKFSPSFFSYQDVLLWHFRTLKTRKRRFQGHVAANLSDGRAAEFVNIGRKVVVAAGTGSRDEYIMITQEYKGRRELTQSSCPKVTRGRCLLHVRYRLAATRTPQSRTRY